MNMWISTWPYQENSLSVRMATNPKPDKSFIGFCGDGAIMRSDSGGPNFSDLFELQ
jgi:hypothetical protein